MALVNTTHGEMDDSLLTRKDGVYEDDNEKTTWIEYWLNDELVHRSVHVELKQNVLADGMAAMLG
jgi:hypothetical protein